MSSWLMGRGMRVGCVKCKPILVPAICVSNARWQSVFQWQQYSHKNFRELPEPVPPKGDESLRDKRNQGIHSHVDSSNPPLSMLPLGMVLRSLATSAVSSTPMLLPLALRVLEVLAYSKTPLFNADRNPAIRYVLDKTLYKQFCAGENAVDVRNTVKEVKKIGFTGAILAYAKESPPQPEGDTEKNRIAHEILGNTTTQVAEWLDNSLETIRLAEPGDFVAFKFTGAGPTVRSLLLNGSKPSPDLEKAIDCICELSRERGVRVLFDGEQHALQPTIDDWTIQVARRFNSPHDSPIIFGTYQSYKKTTPSVISQHLALAQQQGFSIGIKLVRGAYLATDPPDILQDNKDNTDSCYDNCAASILTRKWNSTIKGAGEYPPTSIIFATHNAASVRRAYEIFRAGQARSEILFAQLHGMADEISCELVQINSSTQEHVGSANAEAALPIYKYMAWGTTRECMKYLLRRAEENRDAVKRTKEDRNAMWIELLRRIKLRFRIA